MIRRKISNYIWPSYRRRILDNLQTENANLFKGIVLDIGGRDRGNFKKPKDKVERWIFADIAKEHDPDIILDVSRMDEIENDSIDVILAMELFEHVQEIDKGLDECLRVLKKDGLLIMSVPFMYPIHADPFDFQRWTLEKWKKSLARRGFQVEKVEVTGRFFVVIGDMLRNYIKQLPFGLRHLGYLFFPLLDFFVFLERKGVIAKGEMLKSYHGGYFIVVRK